MILYKFLFAVITINAISETVYLGWITSIGHHHSARFAYYLYIFVSKLALSSFVVSTPTALRTCTCASSPGLRARRP